MIHLQSNFVCRIAADVRGLADIAPATSLEEIETMVAGMMDMTSADNPKHYLRNNGSAVCVGHRVTDILRCHRINETASGFSPLSYEAEHWH